MLAEVGRAGTALPDRSTPETLQFLLRDLLVPGRSVVGGSLHAQPHSSLVDDVIPQPAERHDHPIAHFHQQIRVREAPEKLADEPAQLKVIEPDHCCVVRDRRQIIPVSIGMWRRRGVAAHACGDELGNVLPHLLRRGAIPGTGFPDPSVAAVVSPMTNISG